MKNLVGIGRNKAHTQSNKVYYTDLSINSLMQINNQHIFSTIIYCGVSTDFVVKQICDKAILEYPVIIKENKAGYEAIKRFFIKIKPTIRKRIISKIKKFLSA